MFSFFWKYWNLFIQLTCHLHRCKFHCVTSGVNWDTLNKSSQASLTETHCSWYIQNDLQEKLNFHSLEQGRTLTQKSECSLLLVALSIIYSFLPTEHLLHGLNSLWKSENIHFSKVKVFTVPECLNCESTIHILHRHIHFPLPRSFQRILPSLRSRVTCNKLRFYSEELLALV
jgi:hypothetical protein